MGTKNILAASIAAILAPALQNAAIQDEQPACTAALPATASGVSACPDKTPGVADGEHHDTDAPSAIGGFLLKEDGGYLLLENAGRIALERLAAR